MDVAAKMQNSGRKIQCFQQHGRSLSRAQILFILRAGHPMVMGKRTELLRANDHDGLKALEKECLANNAKHKDWECTKKNEAYKKWKSFVYALSACRYHRRILQPAKLPRVYSKDTESKHIRETVINLM